MGTWDDLFLPGEKKEKSKIEMSTNKVKVINDEFYLFFGHENPIYLKILKKISEFFLSSSFSVWSYRFEAVSMIGKRIIFNLFTILLMIKI